MGACCLLLGSYAPIFSEGKKEIETVEPRGVELSVDLPEKFPLKKKEVSKFFVDYFNEHNIPVKKKSRLAMKLRILPPILNKVSKLSELVRAEFKVEVQLLGRGKKKPYYTYTLVCKGLEEGEANALKLALKSMRMDERELDLLAEKLKELAGKGFY